MYLNQIQTRENTGVAVGVVAAMFLAAIELGWVETPVDHVLQVGSALGAVFSKLAKF